MKIENDLYRLKFVWVSANGGTKVHCVKHLFDDYNDLRAFKDKTIKIIELHGGIVISCTIKSYGA